MKLYHKDDVALELIDDRDDLQRSIEINKEFYIPSSQTGIVKLISPKNSDKYNIQKEDEVYFDPRMYVEIKELNLIVIDIKAVLMKKERVVETNPYMTDIPTSEEQQELSRFKIKG